MSESEGRAVRDRYLKLAAENDSHSGQDLRELGYRLLDYNFLEEAEKCLERSVALDPAWALTIYHSIANIAIIRGQEQRARATARRMLSASPGMAELPFLFHSLAQISGDFPEMIRQVRRMKSLLIDRGVVNLCSALEAHHISCMHRMSMAGSHKPTWIFLVLGQSNAANPSSVGFDVGERGAAFHSARLFPLFDPIIGADGRGDRSGLD